MNKLGIDSLGFYTPHYYLDLTTLAKTRGIDPDKFYKGIEQRKMAVLPPDEDIITMASNAAEQALQHIDRQDISWVFFATESGIDQSKAAGLFLHDLLGLPSHCRSIELKQACYSATAGLQLALSLLKADPSQKILIIASDVSRYGLGTNAEGSQGAGAMAMVLSSSPRILAIEPESACYTENVMDFWRPNYKTEALVDGRYSSKLYLKTLEDTWNRYTALSGRGYDDHDYFCFHVPVAKLAKKAHKSLTKLGGNLDNYTPKLIEHQLERSLYYAREIGNCYAASLYVALTSLLDQATEDLSNKRVGFFSYGSGCVAEYFSGVIQSTYKHLSNADFNNNLLKNRKALTQEQYEDFYNFAYPIDGSECKTPTSKTGRSRLTSINEHQRNYENIS